MSDFVGNFAAIEASEIVERLLEESDQAKGLPVNSSRILEHLNLEQLIFSFEEEIPRDIWGNTSSVPRALLDFKERLVAVDEGLYFKRQRFVLFHEIAHYVLPDHRKMLYVCSETDLSFQATIVQEKEANEFAAELLFKGAEFTRDANSHEASAVSVKQLAEKYEASFEATARRLTEKSSAPRMLAVFTETPDERWCLHYCHASPSFRSQYFSGIEGDLPADVASALTQPGCGILDVEKRIFNIGSAGGVENRFLAEFFTNTYKVFCFLTPERPGGAS